MTGAVREPRGAEAPTPNAPPPNAPTAADPAVYLVGLPERPFANKHPGGSRYELFRRHLRARSVHGPLAKRYYGAFPGVQLDALVERATGKPHFSLAPALVDGRAALHMLGRRGAVYHVTRGEMDVYLLPRVARRTGNYVVASFHESAARVAYYLDGPRIAEQLHGAVLLGECQRPYFAERLPPERIFVVHHGVDTEFFRPAEAPPAEPLLIAVGSHMRDGRTLTAAMRLVWRANPRARLTVVGAGTSKDSAPPAADDPRLTLVPRIDDRELLHAYQSSAVAVLALDDAVANNALLEQMACGLPAVATDVGSVREYLGDDAGVLVPPRDPEALARAVLQLLDDPARRARMAAAARQRALAFDHRVAAQRLGEVYRRVAALGQ